MGTVMNGNVWSGACVNGKVVSGLAKNGVVFYRKPVSTYKRRIMVGDNLKGVTIYNDIKPGYYSILNEYYPNNYGNENFIVPSVMAIPFSDAKSPSSNGYTYNVQGNMINFYNYYNGTENITPFATNSNSDYIVSTVVDTNPSYKHLFIEDENIRPLQIGDIITDNTVFYFTFPDDFNNEEQTSSSGNVIVVQENNNDVKWRIELDKYDNNWVLWNFYRIGTAGGGNVSNSIYRYGTMLTNVSKKIASDMVVNHGLYGTIYCRGTVIDIDENNLAYKYIFVDKTTLGT